MLQIQPTSSHYRHRVSVVELNVYIVNRSIAKHFDGFADHFSSVYASASRGIDSINSDFLKLKAHPLSIKVEWDEPEKTDDFADLVLIKKESSVQRRYALTNVLEAHFPAYIEPYFGIYFKGLYNKKSMKVLNRDSTTPQDEYKIEYEGIPFAVLKEATGQLSMFYNGGPFIRLKHWEEK